MLKEATAELEQAVNLPGGGAVYLASLAHAYGVAGRRGGALKLIRQLEGLAAAQHVSSYDMALAFAGVDDKDQAFFWLEKAVSDHAGDRAPGRGVRVVTSGSIGLVLIHGRPLIAKPFLCSDSQVEIAAIHPALSCGTWPRALMEYAGWCLIS